MINEISYGIIPVRNGKVLALRVYDNWDFPKGKPDPGEVPLETAARELMEESGLKNPVFKWGTAYGETIPYKKGKKIARYFLAECNDGDVVLLPNPESGIVEHHGFKWIELAEARAMMKERLFPVIEWAQSIMVTNGAQ